MFASTKITHTRLAFRVVGGLFALVVMGGLPGAVLLADDPPKPTPTTKPAAKTSAKTATTKPARASKAVRPKDDDISAARKAAVASVKGGKEAPKASGGEKGAAGAPRVRRLKTEEGRRGSAPVRKMAPTVSGGRPGGRGVGAARAGEARRSPTPEPKTKPPASPGGVDRAHRPPVRPTSRADGAKTEPGRTPPAAGGAGAGSTTAPAPLTRTTTTMRFCMEVADPESRTYRFDYVDTPWVDVLADFSRMSGLSWLNQPDEPVTGDVTYRSPHDFTYEEALEQLNEMLLGRPVNKYLIQRKDKYLTLNRLADIMRDIEPDKMFGSFEELTAADLDPFGVVLVHWRVPEGWTPYEIIERYRTLFSDTYGTQVVGDDVLELTGLVREHVRFKRVIERLTGITEPKPADLRPTVTIPLQRAKASDVQTMLRQLFPVSTPAMKGRRRGPGVDPKQDTNKRIDIIANIKNNAIIIKAPRRRLVEIQEMIAKLDQASDLIVPQIKVIKLEHASAVGLAQVVRPIMQKQTAKLKQMMAVSYVSPEMRASMEMDLIPATATNSVVIIGHGEGLARAEQLVRQWDVADADAVHEIIHLEHADAASLAATLMQIFQSRAVSKGAPRTAGVRVTPQSSDTILVSCSEQEIEKVKKLVVLLDVPPGDELREHFVQLKAAQPSVLAPVLQQIFSGRAAPIRRAAPARKGRPQPRQATVISAGGARFIPDDASGLLLVICNDEDWQKAESLIRKLDDQALISTPVLHTFELAHADASDVVNMLNQMMPVPAGRAQSGPRPTIMADTVHNTVKVFASGEFIAKVTPLVAQLDVQTTSPLHIIRLEHCNAGTIAPILLQSFGGRPMARPVRRPPRKGKRPQRPQPRAAVAGSVRIVAEPITNALLVNAPPKELEQIKQLVAEMESAAIAKTDTRVVMTAENRPAAEIAETLRVLTGGAPGGTKGRKGRVRAAAAAGGLKIVPSGNRVILDGPQDEVAEAIQMFSMLDTLEQTPIARKYVVKDAEEDEKKLRAMLALRPPKVPAARQAKGGKQRQARSAAATAAEAIQIYADTYENTLLIRAMPEDFVLVDELLRLIMEDPEQVEGAPIIEPQQDFFLVQLRHKKAWDLGFILEDLLNPGGQAGGVQFMEGPSERMMLVLGCKPAQRSKVEDYIRMFDVPEIGALPNTIVIESDKMPALELIRQIKENYVSPTGRKLQVIIPEAATSPVQVINIHEGEPDAAGAEAVPVGAVNPCVVPASLLGAVEALALGQAVEANRPRERLDPAACPICGQNPCALPAQLMQSLDAIALASADEPPEEPDPAAPEDGAPPPAEHNHPPAEQFDEGAVPSGEPEPAVAQPAVAADAADSTASDEPADTQPVRLLHDPVTGKIIISGPEEDLDAIQELIEILTPTKTQTVYRVFPLKYADVNIAAQLLNNIFNQAQRAARRPRQQRKQPGQQQGGKNAQGGKKQQARQQPVPAPVPARIKVVPDPRTRSLFVAAPSTDIPLITEVLRKIDSQVPPSEQNIKVFYLKNLDATQVVQNLREILGLSATGRRQPTPPQRRGQQKGSQQQRQQALQMQGQQGQGIVVSTENVKLTADTQTNAIIAKAPQDTLALIESLIKELDEAPNTAKVEMRRVQLVHARATEVASIVKEVVSQITSAPGGGGRRGPRGGRPGGGRVSVHADVRTNSVVLAGQVKDLERAEGIVHELDMDESGSAAIRQFAVKGDPSEIAKTLKDLFGARGKQTDIVITANAATGVVLVKAPAPQMAEIERQILAMDEKVGSEKALREIKLKFADAETVARNLQEIFGETGGRRRRAGQKITIRGNKSNKTLYVQCPDDAFDEIKQVALGMDKQPEGLQVQAFHLEHASAIAVQKQLEMLMRQAVQTRGMGDVQLDLIAVLPDARTNSLIVSGGPLTFLLIGQVLEQLDVEPDTPVKRETKTYTLTSAANARDLARNIKEMYRGESPQKTGIEPPTVTFNPAGNTLTVKANRIQHEEIKENIIEPVQLAVGEPMADYQVKLHFARADEIKPVLEEFMNKWRQARGNKPQDAFTVTADPNSNILLVNCSPSTKDVFDKQLAELDTEAVKGTERKLRTYPLKYANINAVRDTINQAFRRVGRVAQRDQVAVSLDGNTNSVLVLANDRNQETIAEMIRSMDVEGGVGTRQDYIYQVENARAVDLSSTLNNIIRNSKMATRGKYPVWTFGDDATNTLVINGSQAEYDSLLQTIEALDVESGAGRITQTFEIEYAEPWHLPRVINEQFRTASRNPNDKVVASYMNGTMTVVVSANPENMEKVAELIEASDKVSTSSLKQTKFIQLEHARADEASRTLNEAFRSKTVRNRQGQWPVTVTADVASNNLIVTAKVDMFEEIEQMVAAIDVEQPGERLRRIFKLTYADPGSVSRAIRESFRQFGRGTSARDEVRTADDWTTNSVIITASQENMIEIERLIAEMDKPGDKLRTQHIIELANTNSADVARSLQQIFDAANRGRRTQSGSVTIRAIEGTTKIAVLANAEELKQIQELVNQIDVKGGRSVHTVTMPEMVSAKSVADNINKLFGSGRGRGGDGLRAEYHEPTNTLLVYATESEFERVNSQVISVLSAQDTIGELKIFKVPLQYATADEVAQTLQDFFDKKSGTKSQRGLPYWMRSANEQLENQVTIVAEPASNMLMLYCTETVKKMIDDLLEDIDTDEPVGGKKVMEMVALKYMDAADMLSILTEYLKVSKRTKEDADSGLPWWMRGRGGKKEEKAVLAGDMRLRAVDSSNSIIVVGRPESVTDVLEKIKELDVEDTDGANVPKVIRLAHANASELADTLDRTFNDPNRKKSRGASYIPPNIVAVEATNSLIVMAKPAEFNLIKKMAEGLDAEMEDEPSGVRILPVAVGRNVEELAREIEQRLNDAEQNRKQINKDYRPSLVSIGADVTSNALLVAASKAKFEEVKRLVDQLVAMGPAGGTSRQVIKLKNLSPEQAKQLIEQLKQGSSGSSSGASRRGRGRRGRRSDADWTQNRRYERSLGGGVRVRRTACAASSVGSASRTKAFTDLSCDVWSAQRTLRCLEFPPAKAGGSGAARARRTACAATVPVLCMQIALGTAIAQTNPNQPAPDRRKPVITTIHPRRPTTQPARAKTVTPEERIRATTQTAGVDNMSDEAREAMRRRLSGAPIEIATATSDSIVIDANDQDMEIILSILDMLDTAIPAKRIEYVKLTNARAKDLAKTLQDVFAKIQQKGERPVMPEDKVDIIADPRTNGIYIAATEEKMAQALALIQKNEAAASDYEKNVRSFVFQNRRVSEAGEVLKKMVSSYLKQRGLPVDQIGIELDPHTNSILVTAGETDLKIVEQFVQVLDADLPEAEDDKKAPMGQADIMLVPLRVADADKLGTLLNELLQRAATGDTPMKDFIRRMRLLDEDGNPIAEIDLNRPIAVFGDPDSNALIIASTRDNCLIMKQVAMAFDKEPARAEVRHEVLTLRYADATEVADQLGTLLTESEGLTQRPGKSEKSGRPDGEAGALVYKAVVKADARTNQVVVVGRPDAVAVLTGLITKLDVKGLDVMPFEIVKLEYASATALEQALTDMMEKRAEALPQGTGPNAGKSEKVIITADPRSESLIIAARRVRLEELRGLIAKLDVSATALVEDIRPITLRNSTATDLAQKLKDLWEQRKSQREGGSGGLKLEVPAIVADERSNSLIVAASKGDFEAIKAVVDKIENLELNPMANIYIVRMKYNSAKQLAPAFSALFQKRAEMRTVDGKVRPEDEVAIEVDEVTNALLVAASRENHAVLMQKIAELDQEIGVMGQIEFFVCDNVSARRIKETIEELFQEGVFKPGGARDSQVAQDREKVTISVDDRSNILIVSASPENMDLVREVYRRMNSVTMPWDVAITKLITIEHGDSVKIAAQVQEYFDSLKDIRSGGDSGGKTGFEITVFADERSNRIIVGGTKDGIDSAVEMIRRLDVLPGEPGQLMQVYTLTDAPATRIGEMLENVFQERNQPRQGATGPQVADVKVTVEINETSNSLLVNASREDHILIADLIGKLDRPSALLHMVKVFPLRKARAGKLKEILEELFQAGQGGQTGGSQMMNVVADERTNAVVVTAPPGELDNIAILVARLDETPVRGAAEIGIFACENEDAEKMAELLNGIVTGQGDGGGGSQENEDMPPLGSMLVSFQTTDESGRDVLLQAIHENVQITFNGRTNSVVAVAPPASLRLIEQLVRNLDRIEKRPVLVKVFHLLHADAAKMIDLLEEMFALDANADQERAFQEGREIQVEGGTSATGGVPSAMSQEGPTRKGTFGRPKTTFVSDERTNSVIAAGWPEDIDVVADIIDQLDSRAVQDRDSIVVALNNAKADEVQTALDAFFQAEQQRLDRLGDVMSPQQRMEREVSLVAHEESNQVIVSVSPRYKSQVLRMVEQLDRPPPQVMIQVVIAEVTLDDRFEMGLEFALQELRFSETAVPGGNGVLQSSHFDVIGGTDLGAAGAGLGGISFTITGEDFNFLVRALQSDSRLEVIQRPMIMCQDNQEANITIGQNVPFVRNTTVSDSGQVTASVEYEEVGIILTVEPQINPDGFVYLRVAPEISAITDSTVDIGNGIFAPIFTERSAETTVVIKDGETVVIGGLITTTEIESESKVPFLGDMPGLGVLFRTTSRRKERTELLIALTPRVVRTVEDGRRLSIEERDKGDIITPNMKQSPLFDGIQVLPEEEDVQFSIEAPPPAERPIKTEPQDKYGPKAPRYGPLVPAEEDIVARGDRRTTHRRFSAGR